MEFIFLWFRFFVLLKPQIYKAMKNVYVYIDKSNAVVYCNFTDSKLNNQLTYFDKLRKYTIKENNLKTFITYYSLRLHTNALKNVVN